jgi:hypothetical protein
MKSEIKKEKIHVQTIFEKVGHYLPTRGGLPDARYSSTGKSADRHLGSETVLRNWKNSSAVSHKKITTPSWTSVYSTAHT